MIHSYCEMTFAENLKCKADMHKFELDVDCEMSDIKKKMEAAYYAREYIIELIKPHVDMTMAFGGTRNNYYIVFVPKEITLKDYCELIVEALRKLGFDDNSISLDLHSYPRYNSYKITVRW